MNTSHSYVMNLIERHLHTPGGSPEPVNLLYVRLYQALKSLILQRNLPALWCLPGSRTLAEHLKISRSTVVRAYEMLEMEQMITVRYGSGYRISAIERPAEPTENAESTRPALGHLVSQRGLLYVKSYPFVHQSDHSDLAFRPGIPPVDIFPVGQWKNLLNNYWRYVKSSTLNYTHPRGDERLREKIRDFLQVSRGIACNKEQIIVVSGSVQSIYLLSHAFLDPSDTVLLENPTFPNVIGIFLGAGAKVSGVECDEQGLLTSKLPQPDAASRIKMVHVTPGCQYPLGMAMAMTRRRELIDWVHSSDALLIENDYEHEISARSGQMPTLYSLDTKGRTIYLGTFNRLLYPSIRLGFMVLPPELVTAVEALQAHSHRFVSPYLQEVMQQFIDKNYLYAHLRNLAEVAAEREFLFREQCPLPEGWGALTRQAPSKGLHLCFSMNGKEDGRDAEKKMMARLSSAGITAHALSQCYLPGTAARNGLILGYSAVPPVAMREKFRVWKRQLSIR